MRNFPKKRVYRSTSLPQILGQAHEIKVLFRNFPVRQAEDDASAFKEYYPDFNRFLIEAIWNAIPDAAILIERACAAPQTLNLEVRNAPPFSMEIGIQTNLTVRHFRTTLPDAIIEALRNANIRR
jgi:hypothetical protein